MFAKSLPISLEMRGRGKRGEGEVCDVQLYALEIRAGYCNEVCVCVCIKSILFCELQVGKFSGQVIIVRVNESRSEYPLSVLRISFPGFY